MIAWTPMREETEGCIATTSYQAEVEASQTIETVEVEETGIGPTDEDHPDRTPNILPIFEE